MLRIDRILFPTDRSDSAEQARRHASFLADRHGAQLHAIRVEEREADWNDVIDIQEADVLSDLRLDADPGALSPTQVVERSFVHPSVADGILSYAAEHDIDLIVMGTHGRRGVQRWMMGSIAEEVVRRSECPVLTVVARTQDPDDEAPASVGRLLVPVDFSDPTDSLIGHAREIALAYDADIALLHVIEPVSLPNAYGTAPLTLDPDSVREDARAALEDRADRLREAGLDVDTHLRTGHPAENILAAVEDEAADVVTIATHGRTGMRRILLGSIAEKVVRRAPVLVFTVTSFGRSLIDAPAASARS